MLFNSYVFLLLFLPLVLTSYFFLNRHSIMWGNIFLLFSSVLFYMDYSTCEIVIVLGSVVCNYLISLLLAAEVIIPVRRSVLIGGVLANIGLLGYFKYADFFVENLNVLLGCPLVPPHHTLPLGISFFTLTQIAFLINCYRRIDKHSSPLMYSLFVLYFPHLLAGPIVYHKDLVGELSDKVRKRLNWENINGGIFLFAIGLFKKICMADKLALHVSTGFYQATQLSCVEAWFLSLSYTLQLYLDFSGYTDMALGISRMFNIDLPINFDSPYKATSIQDFWRRWHVTLGKYIRDFVYVPLGGSRGGVLRTAINLILTFSISGLWHGAAWTFIFWGFFHGVGVAVNMFWHRLQKIRISGLIGWIITFNFVNLGWIFFRAENFTQAFEVIKGMCCVHGLLNESVMSAHGLWDKYVVLLQNLLYESTGKSVFLPVKILSFLMICLFCKNSQELLRGFRSDAKYFIFASVLFLFAFLSIGGYSEFIYFRF